MQMIFILYFPYDVKLFFDSIYKAFNFLNVNFVRLEPNAWSLLRNGSFHVQMKIIDKQIENN